MLNELQNKFNNAINMQQAKISSIQTEFSKKIEDKSLKFEHLAK